MELETSYTFKNGFMTIINGDVYLGNNNPKDAYNIFLTLDEMKLVLKLLESVQKDAIWKQKLMDSNPPSLGCDENDGPSAPVLYRQKILFHYAYLSVIMRAITWIVGRQVKITLEAHHCSYEDKTKLISDSPVIEIGLDENLETIQNFLDRECD